MPNRKPDQKRVNQPPQQQCMRPGCKRTDIEGHSLCTMHYQQGYRLVASGEATWRELFAKGWGKLTIRGSELRREIMESK
jgi:hypothetical protein